MKAGELIIGWKYVPINKTVMGDLNTSVVWKNAVKKNQYFLYYIGQEDVGDYLFSDVFNDKNNGDYFLPEDVIPYVEPQTGTAAKHQSPTAQTAIPLLQSFSELMLSKRELFAAMAMQGMLANNAEGIVDWNYEIVAVHSRKAADALIKELKANEHGS